MKIPRPIGTSSQKGHKFNRLVIFQSSAPQKTHGWIYTKSGIAIGVANVITCDKFFGDWLRGVDSAGVEFCHYPLTSPVAINTGLELAHNP